TGLAVNLRLNLVLGAITRPRGLLDRLFHRGDHHLLVDGLLTRDGVRDLQQFQAICTHSRCHHSLRSLSSRPATGRPAALRPRLLEPVPGPASTSVSGMARRALATSANAKARDRPPVVTRMAPSSLRPSRRHLKRRCPSSGTAVSIQASRPAKRSKSSSLVKGRSIPGELTSNTYSPGMGSAASSRSDRARLNS